MGADVPNDVIAKLAEYGIVALILGVGALDLRNQLIKCHDKMEALLNRLLEQHEQSEESNRKR